MYGSCVGTRMDKNVELCWVRVWGEQPSVVEMRELDAFMMVHGDDFITLGSDEALREVEHVMSRSLHNEGSGSPWCRSR